jgi:hypothetical protein
MLRDSVDAFVFIAMSFAKMQLFTLLLGKSTKKCALNFLRTIYLALETDCLIFLRILKK